MSAVTPEDMQEVVMMLIRSARGGSIAAAKELLDRTLGKPTQEIEVVQQQESSPDEVRTKLAALLMSRPELRDVLEDAGYERRLESSPAETLRNQVSKKISKNPEEYENDEPIYEQPE